MGGGQNFVESGGVVDGVVEFDVGVGVEVELGRGGSVVVVEVVPSIVVIERVVVVVSRILLESEGYQEEPPLRTKAIFTAKKAQETKSFIFNPQTFRLKTEGSFLTN